MSRRFVLSVAVAFAAVAAPATAQVVQPDTGATGTQGVPTTATTASPAAGHNNPAPARLWLTELQGVSNHKVKVGDKFQAIGRIAPYVPHQKVQIRVAHNGHVLRKRYFKVTEIGHSGVGRFHMSTPELVRPGPFKVTAVHNETKNQRRAKVVSSGVSVRYPDLDPGDHGPLVSLFSRLLRARGYYSPHTSSYNSTMQLSVLAFRKVNGMERITNATPGIFKALAKHKGGFKLRYPNAGRHVEVDISRQVMALADHGKAQYIFHVSTGAPATPTITGHYSFYRKDPGYNSEGMYYSSYWHNGYAVHGYASVPTYNASHGCVRTPISEAIFIYNWIDLGESIYTYY